MAQLSTKKSLNLDAAKAIGNAAEAKESIDAMTFIGTFEQTQNSEFFFLN